jgi:hypothetical protein
VDDVIADCAGHGTPLQKGSCGFLLRRSRGHRRRLRR